MKYSMCLVFVFVVTVLSACQEEVEMKILDEEIADEFKASGMGPFVDLGTGHELSGKASFLVNNSDDRVLRFEDFSVINGPDVNVYLSKTSEFKDVIDLGDLKATQGNLNYELSSQVDLKEHRFVLIWCVKYAVLFGYAEVK